MSQTKEQIEKTVIFFFAKCAEKGLLEGFEQMELLRQWAKSDTVNASEFSKIAYTIAEERRK